MRDQLVSIFSYLFMTASFVAIISSFLLIVIGLRYFMDSISQTEERIVYYLIIILGASIVFGPVFHYISNRLEKVTGRMEEV